MIIDWKWYDYFLSKSFAPYQYRFLSKVSHGNLAWSMWKSYVYFYWKFFCSKFTYAKELICCNWRFVSSSIWTIQPSHGVVCMYSNKRPWQNHEATDQGVHFNRKVRETEHLLLVYTLIYSWRNLGFAYYLKLEFFCWIPDICSISS